MTGDFCFNPGRGIAVRPKPYTTAKNLPAKNERMDNRNGKAVAYIGPFTLRSGKLDENIREMLCAIFSQSFEKFSFSCTNSAPSNPDIVIRGNVLNVAETKIDDKEAREAKQAAAMMLSFLKGFSKLSDESENPPKTLKIPVPEAQEKVLVKVRVLVSASYAKRDVFYSEGGVPQ